MTTLLPGYWRWRMASMLSGLGSGVGVSVGAGVAEGAGVAVGASVGEAANVALAAVVGRAVGCGVRMSTMIVVVGCGLSLQAASRERDKERAKTTIPYRLTLVTFFISIHSTLWTCISWISSGSCIMEATKDALVPSMKGTAIIQMADECQMIREHSKKPDRWRM